MKKSLFALLCAFSIMSCSNDEDIISENQDQIYANTKNLGSQKQSQNITVMRYYSHNLMKHYFGAETLPYSGAWSNEGVAFTTSSFSLGVGHMLPMAVMVNPVNQDMIITTNPVDRQNVENQGYIFREVIGYPFPQTNNTFAVHRYYNKSKNGHFYTKNFGELGGGGGAWVYEGVAFYAL